jgi:hypothetical protein
MSEFINPMSFEEQARFTAMGVVIDAQNKVRRALTYQNDLREAADRAEQPIDATNVAIYSAYETPQIPARHYRVIFGPKYREQPLYGVTAVAIRVPVRTESFIPEEAIHDNSWNDIFIQAWNEQGDSQNYLLNAKGLVPFENAQEDVEEDYFGREHDLFTVINPAKPRVDLGLTDIKDLLEAYVFHPQSNDDEPPFFKPSI